MSEVMMSVTAPTTQTSTTPPATTTLILPQEPYDDDLVERLLTAKPDLYPQHENSGMGKYPFKLLELFFFIKVNNYLELF